MQIFAPFLCRQKILQATPAVPLVVLQGLFSGLLLSLYSSCDTAGQLCWRSEDNNKNAFAPWLRAIRARQNLINFVVEMANG